MQFQSIFITLLGLALAIPSDSLDTVNNAAAIADESTDVNASNLDVAQNFFCGGKKTHEAKEGKPCLQIPCICPFGLLKGGKKGSCSEGEAVTVSEGVHTIYETIAPVTYTHGPGPCPAPGPGPHPQPTPQPQPHPHPQPQPQPQPQPITQYSTLVFTPEPLIKTEWVKESKIVPDATKAVTATETLFSTVTAPYTITNFYTDYPVHTSFETVTETLIVTKTHEHFSTGNVVHEDVKTEYNHIPQPHTVTKTHSIVEPGRTDVVDVPVAVTIYGEPVTVVHTEYITPTWVQPQPQPGPGPIPTHGCNEGGNDNGSHGSSGHGLGCLCHHCK